MATKLTEAEVRELIGDPEEVARRLEAFSRSARFFHANHDRFIREYPDQWVAVHGNDVAAADTTETLFEEMAQRDMPRRESCIKFVTSKERILIL